MVLRRVAPLGHDEPELREQPTQLIDRRGALLDQALADAVQTQHGLLLGAFDWHEAHAGAGDGLADRLGIVAVVFATLAIGRDET